MTSELKALWKIFEELESKGRLKSIGMNDFRMQNLKTILDDYKPWMGNPIDVATFIFVAVPVSGNDVRARLADFFEAAKSDILLVWGIWFTSDMMTKMSSGTEEVTAVQSKHAFSPPVPTNFDIKLPIELWLEVLSYASTPSIHAVTLTCSTLRWLAQPLLFKVFAICLPSPTSEILSVRRDIVPSNTRARLSVLQYPHIVQAMTELRLIPSAPSRDQGPRTPPPADSDLVDTIFTALPSLINLRRIVCHNVVFIKENLSALSRLPYLKDLELQSCTTTCAPADFPDFSQIPLETLAFEYPYNSMDYFRNPRFLALFLQSRKLKRILAGPANDILLAIAETAPPPSLSILEIPVSCVSSPLFVSTLASVPSVQELSMYMAIGNTHLPPLEYLPPDVLPNLRSYRGPRTYAPWFTRDRDVTDVEFSLPAQPKDLSATLMGLANKIESLSCKVDSLDAGLLKTIHTMFPSLKHLAISGVAVDIDCLASVLAIAKVHRSLTSIQISVQTGEPRLTDSWGAMVAKMFLTRLIRSYPVLERARLVYQPQVSVVWNRPGGKQQPVSVVDSSELRIEKK
ncbi:hypothetical protein H0H81_010737 [Sphagnurus paluster]|uniref:F-box domain-containing protein n=1 Tax=Sphagnurus paluster TaxID=117069 RepID=A0A9P7GPR6_9AGAR|nr:hypothetical protein H0H81_010737 [Sphagnurus paluster]